MTKYLLLFAIGLFCATHSFSQAKVRGSIKGALVDTVGSRQLLANATVSLTPAKGDSSDAEFVVTDKKGGFSFSSLDAGAYKLVITYQGYSAIVRNLTISETSKDIDLSTLIMQRSDETLEAVVVQRPPITIKKDTVEYNAGMFATKPNAVAEDLLKKMPGIQVDKNGTVTAHGETVSRVLVNGKRFFGDDPKMATRNLPPDVIDKIQVFDDLSDQSKFTGFDDGNRVKTINIVTKKDKSLGYFGKAVGGAGTNQTYDESLNFHRMNGNEQISVLGQANDVNKQNFTPGDIFGNGFGGRRGGGGGSSSSSTGITTVWAGGGNYRNTFGKTDVTGSYFFNNQHVSVKKQDSTIRAITSKEVNDSSNTNTGGSYNLSRNNSHRVQLNIESKFDSLNSMVFRPNITFQSSTPYAISNTYITDQYGTPLTSTNGHSSSYTSGFNINGTSLQLRHKFKKAYRTISLDVNVTENVNNGTGYNYAINKYYALGYTDSINQYTTNSTHAFTISPTLSYTEPIGKNQVLEFNYNHSYTNNKSLNETFDFTDSAHGYSQFDTLFSNSYKFTSNSDRLTTNYRIQNEKYNFSAGTGVQFTSFNSLNTTKDILVSHTYTNLTPTMNFQYMFSRTSHLRINYSGRTGTPTPNQLQPLVTTSDKINYQVGNPDLRPQFTHSLRMLYTNFNPSNQRVIFATINASTVVNDIQNKVITNEKGGQTTTYANLDGTYSVSGYFNYGFALKKPKSNLNLISNVNYSQNQTLQADSADAAKDNFTHLYTRNTTLSETVSWTTNIKKNFDMNFSSTSTYNIARSTAIAGRTANNLNYFTQVFTAEITAYTNSGWLIATTFDYTYTNTRSAGYNTSVPLLNPSIAKQLFKKKNGELRLTVFDLLNQNAAVTKTVSNTQVQYEKTNVLSRYAMLTFTYNLNNFAGANQKRMPGMFPGRFRGGGGPGGGWRQGGGPGGMYQL